MLKTLRYALAAALMTSAVAAYAQVDLNEADQVTLDGISGIGPTTSQHIIEERQKGEFKDWADFESRVPGVGGSKAAELSDAGVTVNGEPRPSATSAVNDLSTTGAPAAPAN